MRTGEGGRGAEGQRGAETLPIYSNTFIYFHIPLYTFLYLQIPPNTFIYLHIPSYTLTYVKISNIRKMRANTKHTNGHDSSPRASPRVRI